MESRGAIGTNGVALTVCLENVGNNGVDAERMQSATCTNGRERRRHNTTQQRKAIVFAGKYSWLELSLRVCTVSFNAPAEVFQV